MNLAAIFLLGVGLSMDAFAVSIANGANKKFDKIFISALIFGLFQGVQPVLGWTLGLNIRNFIVNTDHWIAFFLLFFIGGKMIYQSIKPAKKSNNEDFSNSIFCILMLGIATSIDALVVGLSFSFLQMSIMRPALLIGIITFCMCLAGFRIGKKYGPLLGRKFEITGGLILCLLGLKILIEHLIQA